MTEFSAEIEKTPGELETITSLFSIEVISMFLIAGLLDLASLVFLYFGLDDFWILDIIGLIFIGGWTYFRSQTIKVTRGAKVRLTTRALKLAERLKWLKPMFFISEFIPYIGGVLPSWTLIVYFELKR